MSDIDRPIWLEMYSALFPDAKKTGMDAEIDRVLNAPKRAAYCAQIGGEIVGFAEYNVRDFANGCVSQPVPFLEGIWIRPEARGQGIARALVMHLEGIAKAQGHSEFGSDVDISNTGSLDMHAALGFEETERVVYFRKEI